LRGEPEGLVLDATTGVLAVAVRNPGALVLVDAATGAERRRVPLGGAARHLALAGPGGPVLVPSENDDKLYRVSLPDGASVTEAPVGRQPHDVAPAAGGVVFVGDELADTVHVFNPGGTAKVVPAPVQPGGVAASADGSVVVVVGVRGRRIEAYSTAPYGLAVDLARQRLYVTLTERNELRSFRIDGTKLTPERTWTTVRQPNDVVVDPSTGRVVVAGTADGQLQLLDPQK